MIRLEHAFITALLDSGDVTEYRQVKAFMTADHFFLPDTRSAWNWIGTHVAKHNVLPSREVFNDAIKGFNYANTTDPTTVLADRVHEHYIYNQVQLFIEGIHTRSKADTIEAAKFIAESAGKFRTLAMGDTSDIAVDITQRVAEEQAAYERRKEMEGILGKKWPWPHMNKMTHGMLDGAMYMWYARPGNMKTWLILYVLMYLHYYLGDRPLLITSEMTVEDCQRRWIAMFAGLDYTRYVEGRLNSEEETRWKEALEAFAEQKPIYIASVAGVGGEAAEAIVELCKKLNPTVLGIDGVHLFGEREALLIGQFTKRIKKAAAFELKIPVLATTQRNNPKTKVKEASGDDVGYSDAMLQDVDVLIHTKYIKEDKKIYFRLPKIREGVMDAMMAIHAKPAFDFTEAHVVKEDDTDYGEDDTGANEIGASEG